MKIPPWVSYAFKIIIFLLSVPPLACAAGPQYVGGNAQALQIIFWDAVATTCVTGIYSILGTGSVPSITTLGKVACHALLASLLALGVIIALVPARAEAGPRRAGVPVPVARPSGTALSDIGTKLGLTGSAANDIAAAIAKVQAISLDDLNAAKADADATKDTVASACYGALIDLVKAQQSVQTPGQNTDQPGGIVPTTHVILTFQRGRDFVNALRPGSPVFIACAPLAEGVKLDVVSFIGQVSAGTISLASFGL